MANPQHGLWVVPKANQPKFGAWGGGDGVGIEGEPELCMLGAEGEPTEWTVGDAEGKAAKFGVGGGGGWVGTEGEPELHMLVSMLHRFA